MPWTVVAPIAPVPDESCDARKNYLEGFFDPPPRLLEAGTEGRLIWPLRAAVRAGVGQTLALAAAAFALAQHPAVAIASAPPPAAGFPPEASPSAALHAGVVAVGPDRGALARAFADLAVSGRASYRAFTAASPGPAALAAQATALLTALNVAITAEDITQAAEAALARAHAVATCLGAVIRDSRMRASLGYIATSGEDDPARRPVNIACLAYPQYDLDLTMRAPSGATVDVTTRYVVISQHPTATPEPSFTGSGPIFLFLHGDGSRCEEVDALIAPLLAAGAARGQDTTIIAMDLPSHGCSTMIDPLGPAFANTPPWDNHAPSPVHRPPCYPVLEFLEAFVLDFVAALDTRFHIGPRLVGPMGGSLGGNLTLRLARSGAAWVRHAMAWSPACVWNSLADDLIKQAGPNHCSTEGHRAEEAGTRAIFFHDVFDASTNIGPIQLVAPQGDYWYRPEWQPCKTNILQAGRRERRELYNRVYRQFHYRMDWEQLLYSFQDQDPGSPAHRYETFRANLLLAAGAEDNNSPATQIYSSAQAMADKMKSSGASGRTLFVTQTGHSMHDERPRMMAAAIDAFLNTFVTGALDHANFQHVCDEDIHVTGKIDGGSNVTLTSRRGSILIDGKIDGGSHVSLSAAGDVVIGTVGNPGDRKIDGGSQVSVTAGGMIRLGDKIDNGRTSVIFHAGTGIEIANKIDGGANVRLATHTGGIHVHDKIDNGGTHVVYWPSGSLKVDGGIHGGAHVSATQAA